MTGDPYAIVYLDDFTTMTFANDREYQTQIEKARARATPFTAFKWVERKGRMIWQPLHTEFMDKR